MITDQQSLIKVSGGLLSVLGKGQLNLDVFKTDILVLECVVAGTSFQSLEKIEPMLGDATRLDVKREASNGFDQFAIAFYFENMKLGYIPKEKNEVIARLMDAGKSFFAEVCDKEWEGNWLRLEVKIFITD